MEKILNDILVKLNSMEQGQQRLEQGQQKLGQRQEQMEQGQQKLEQRQHVLEQGQQRLENKVDKLELRMENEVIEKIRGLYDDRSVNHDYFASIRDGQTRIEEKLDMLIRRAMEQDQKLNDHERELRLLRIEK